MAKKSETGPNHSQISEAAYLRYLSRGGAPGSDLDDWVEAERELRGRFASPLNPKAQIPNPKSQPDQPRTTPAKAKTNRQKPKS